MTGQPGKNNISRTTNIVSPTPLFFARTEYLKVAFQQSDGKKFEKGEHWFREKPYRGTLDFLNQCKIFSFPVALTIC